MKKQQIGWKKERDSPNAFQKIDYSSQMSLGAGYCLEWVGSHLVALLVLSTSPADMHLRLSGII
jgi:hypothetical protein